MINISIYSRVEFISYLTTNNINDDTVESTDEYFISILPTGGPKGVKVFDRDHPNVITLIFDDVLQDELKDKYPDGVGYFTARAFTIGQAKVLKEFIYSMDIDKKINIH